MKATIKKVLDKLAYEIELVSQLMTVFAAGIVYGVIEAKWVPTGTFDSDVFGHWSWYHVWLVAMMLVVSMSLAMSHIRWIFTDRKKYVFLMVLAALPLSLMIEDATWFVVKWQPIAWDEWTMIVPGMGLNIGFTWIPLWYFVVTGFAATLYWLGHKYSDKGYKEWLKEENRNPK